MKHFPLVNVTLPSYCFKYVLPSVDKMNNCVCCFQRPLKHMKIVIILSYSMLKHTQFSYDLPPRQEMGRKQTLDRYFSTLYTESQYISAVFTQQPPTEELRLELTCQQSLFVQNLGKYTYNSVFSATAGLQLFLGLCKVLYLGFDV